MLRLLIAALFATFASVAIAQDRPNTILVMDGSGSMWGQIDGVNKIVIAREVVGDLLDTFPNDQNLGLTVYGHRERGNCADIETVVTPGPDTKSRIRDAVNGINPRGKTPMTDSVIAAANALRYTEERATVILVSDGIETCNPDPCAAARALEEAGIDFTAHVIGFDVTDPEALAQMQCLANETGGQFSTAANASELAKALTTVVAEPVHVPQTVRIVGVLRAGGPEVTERIRWNILPGTGANLDGTGPGFAIDLPEGAYDLVGIRESDGAEVMLDFDVAALEADRGQRVEVVFPEPEPDPTMITFRAVIGTESGPEIDTPVIWNVTSEADGVVVDGEQANPLPATLDQGSHTVSAYWAEQEVESRPRQFIVTKDPREIVVVFEPPAITASIGAPATAVVGSTIEVVWNGPGNADDFIGIGKAGASGSARWRNFSPVTDGAPLQLLVPPEPGQYVIAYFDDESKDALGSAAIEVLPADITLSAPSEVSVSEVFEVAWTGPNYREDFIGIGEDGASGSAQWRNYTHTAEGSPLRLQAPSVPGEYLIKYFFDQENWAAFEVPITVTEPQVTLTAPARAEVSQFLEVAWTGPDTPGDFIGIGKVDAGGSAQWRNFTYTSEGNPVRLQAPAVAGDHVIKYFLDQNNTPLFEIPITITEPEVGLTAPREADVSQMIEVAWTGPNTPGDFIGIGKVGAGGSAQWRNFTYTSEGNPVRLQAPAEAGDHVIKYFLDQNNTPLFEIPITITEPEVSLTAPREADVSQMIEVAWTGPNTPGDFIGIGKVDAGGSAQWRNHTSTADGNPARLMTPAEPGEYTIKYFLDQGNTPLFEIPITLREPDVSLSAPANAEVSTMIEVAWTGPDTPGDFIGIGKVGAGGSAQWRNHTETSTGNPVQLKVPAEPGDYVIKYFLDQRNTPLFEVPINVTPAAVTMDVPAVVVGATVVDIPWTGPNHPGDFIGIGLTGAGGSRQWQSYAETGNGSPARLRIPTAGGDYLVKYFLEQRNTPALEIPVSVTTPPATLDAPEVAAAGSQIEVAWTGPNYTDDYVGIGKVGAGGSGQWRSHGATADGPVLSITLPDEPGDYVIQYFVGVDRVSIAERPLKIQ